MDITIQAVNQSSPPRNSFQLGHACSERSGSLQIELESTFEELQAIERTDRQIKMSMWTPHEDNEASATRVQTWAALHQC